MTGDEHVKVVVEIRKEISDKLNLSNEHQAKIAENTGAIREGMDRNSKNIEKLFQADLAMGTEITTVATAQRLCPAARQAEAAILPGTSTARAAHSTARTANLIAMVLGGLGFVIALATLVFALTK